MRWLRLRAGCSKRGFGRNHIATELQPAHLAGEYGWNASRRSREGFHPRDFGLVLKPRPGSCRERPRRVTTSWSIPNSPPDGPQVLPAGRLYFRSALSQIVAFGRQFPDQLTKRIRQRRRAVLSAPRKNIPNRPGLQPQCSYLRAAPRISTGPEGRMILCRLTRRSKRHSSTLMNAFSVGPHFPVAIPDFSADREAPNSACWYGSAR